MATAKSKDVNILLLFGTSFETCLRSKGAIVNVCAKINQRTRQLGEEDLHRQYMELWQFIL